MKIPVNQIICGDAFEVLKTFPNESVNSVITSPPYFNLRDYQVEGQIGLEKTYQEYIAKLIAVFNECKRILRKDGTCFINLMDTYAGGGFGAFTDLSKTKQGTNKGTVESRDKICQLRKNNKQIKQKSLMMIPERFGIAMLDNGWILRNDLIWIKKNAMPESVQDRWKKAHEHFYFFVKNKNYKFNLDAIRTKHKEVSLKRAEYELGRNAMGLNPSSMGEKYSRDKKYKDGTEKYYSMPARQVKLNPLGAVPPDYLDVNTNCSQNDVVGEHYATYPSDLILPLIKSGSSEGDIVLDPFGGSMTTCVVAQRMNRKYIGIELNQEYVKIGQERLRQKTLL